ncbi:5690_t:CDS:1, partial [Funneliformis caledonium]
EDLKRLIDIDLNITTTLNLNAIIFNNNTDFYQDNDQREANSKNKEDLNLKI